MDPEEEELRAIRAKIADDLAALGRAQASAAPAGPVEVHEADLPRLLGREGVVLLDCWAVWCGPCRIMEPTIEALAKDFAGKAVVAKMDVDHNPRAAQALGVQGIPTFLIFKDGKPVDRFVGAVPKEQLAMALRRATGPVRGPGPRR